VKAILEQFSSYGAAVNRWRDDFEKDEEIRFQYGVAAAYINHRLRETYDQNASLRRDFPTFVAFQSHSKGEASRLLNR
jgi:hypothetical protein